jgi:TIGR03009 family protein
VSAQSTKPAAPPENKPAAPPAAPPAVSPALDKYLESWEGKMAELKQFSLKFSRTEKDTSTDTIRNFTGYAKYMKSGTGANTEHRAVLEVNSKGKDGKEELAEKIILTGTFLYQFSPATKEIIVNELPKPEPGAAPDGNALTFLFGMKKDKAKERYELSLTPGKEDDKYYVFIDVLPRTKEDKAEFKKARIVLNRDTYLPRQVWIMEPNEQRQVTWDIPTETLNKLPVKAADFDKPTPEPGWQLVKQQPTKVRAQQK